MNPITLIVFFLIKATIAGAEGANPSATLSYNAREKIATLEVGQNLPLLAPELSQGVASAARYRAQSEPSYMKDYFTRFDRYRVENKVDPGSRIRQLGIDVPFSMGFAAKTEIVFARQFRNQSEATNAPVYKLDRLPVTADRAKRMAVGDYAAFEADLSLSADIKGNNLLPPGVSQALSAAGAVKAEVEGRFDVQIFKADRDHIRLRISRRTHLNSEGGASSAVALPPLKITGYSNIDHSLDKAIALKPQELKAAADASHTVTSDWMLDLSQADAAGAFDQLMTGRRLSSGKIVTDIGPLEELAQREARKPENDQKSLVRLQEGTVTATAAHGSTKIGLKAIRFEGDKTFSKSQVESTNGSERSRFLLDSFERKVELKSPFGFTRDDAEKLRADLIHETNSAFQPTQFLAFAVSRDSTLSTARATDIERAKQHVRQTLPESVWKTITWPSWSDENRKYKNMKFKERVIFGIEALQAAKEALGPESNQKELQRRFETRLREFLKRSGASQNKHLLMTSPPSAEIKAIAAGLATGLDMKKSQAARAEAFARLRISPLFQESGTGFLLSLVPEQNLEKSVYYDLDFKTDGEAPLQFSYGDRAKQASYQSLIDMHDGLTSTSIDMRVKGSASRRKKSIR